MRMFQRPEDRMTAVAAAERQRTKAIAEHRRQSAATSRRVLSVNQRMITRRLWSLKPFSVILWRTSRPTCMVAPPT